MTKNIFLNGMIETSFHPFGGLIYFNNPLCNRYTPLGLLNYESLSGLTAKARRAETIMAFL
jgi:hypothetical protein